MISIDKHKKDDSIYVDMSSGSTKKPKEKTDYDAMDIIAMIIATFQIVLPPLFIIFGVLLAAYFLLKLAARVASCKMK